MSNIVLASSSAYRAELLKRLAINFIVFSPKIREIALSNETPKALAIRLAEKKAVHVAQHHPNAIVIGSDQTGDLNGLLLGKPIRRNGAIRQLKAMQGQKVVFYTAMTVILPNSQGKRSVCVKTVVHFLSLTEENINSYLDKEKPYSCAGSFKSEGLGISLVKKIKTTDPSALIGLPLIALVRILREIGCSVP